MLDARRLPAVTRPTAPSTSAAASSWPISRLVAAWAAFGGDLAHIGRAAVLACSMRASAARASALSCSISSCPVSPVLGDLIDHRADGRLGFRLRGRLSDRSYFGEERLRLAARLGGDAEVVIDLGGAGIDHRQHARQPDLGHQDQEDDEDDRQPEQLGREEGVDRAAA